MNHISFLFLSLRTKEEIVVLFKKIPIDVFQSASFANKGRNI
ncbi:hypothetical protein [Leptospira kirschneri]